MRITLFSLFEKIVMSGLSSVNAYVTSKMEPFVKTVSWELLLIVVIESFVLNVTRFLRSNSETTR